MRLFDNIERTLVGPAPFSQPTFDYLNHSASEQADSIRKVLETWFAMYPEADKLELRGRLRSGDDVDFHSAFLELILYTLLVARECQVEIHPAIAQSSRSPDFLVQDPDGQSFYLEATVVAYRSEEEAAAQARLQSLYDTLNRHINSTEYYISVILDAPPHVQPSGRKIAKFLNSKLSNLQIDDVYSSYRENGITSMPTWAYEFEGWTVTFRPIPKSPDARQRVGVRPLGMFESQAKFVDHWTPLRDALADKVNAYGELDLPLVVATNALEHIDRIDIMEALFGKEQVQVFFSRERPAEVVNQRMTRAPNGLWTSTSGPTNTRLSAALIFISLNPWNVHDVATCIYHNPWAQRGYSSILNLFPQGIPEDGQMEFVDGASALDLLGYDRWPPAS